jgi:aldehyde:ferredoxin oxidoreductase
MDAQSAGVTVGFVMDCHEKGILSHDELGGIDAHFGNADALVQLIEKMGKREGIGAILADGAKAAAIKIDKDSEKLAQQIKGLEVTGYDLRCLKTAALSLAVSFRGADHTRSSAYTLDLKGKVDRLKAERGRGKLVKEMEDTYSLLDSFIVCKNAKATFYQELAELAKLYNLVTGIELSADELRLAAERINTLARLINIREGLSRKDDSLPWKVMNEPIPDDGPVKGAFVSQDELDLMLDDYYEARGWTLEGVPKSENLKKLGMDELASLVEGKEA